MTAAIWASSVALESNMDISTVTSIVVTSVDVWCVIVGCVVGHCGICEVRRGFYVGCGVVLTSEVEWSGVEHSIVEWNGGVEWSSVVNSTVPSSLAVVVSAAVVVVSGESTTSVRVYACKLSILSKIESNNKV